MEAILWVVVSIAQHLIQPVSFKPSPSQQMCVPMEDLPMREIHAAEWAACQRTADRLH
jgi:hypothetical protein